MISLFGIATFMDGIDFVKRPRFSNSSPISHIADSFDEFAAKLFAEI